MAPITRSSQHGRPSALQLTNLEETEHRPTDDFDESPQEDDHDHDDDDDDDDEIEQSWEEEQDPFSAPDADHRFNSSTARDLLQPLQQTADRVSRQVEEFAKCLDKFNTARKSSSNQDLWEEAWIVLEKYQEFALNRKHRTTSSSPRSRSSSRNRRSVGDSEREIQKVQFEADLWSLTRQLLVCNCPKSQETASAEQEGRLKELHRYSPNSDIWESFLDSDVAAQECECILAWLQERAASSQVSVENAIADLTLKSERGDGVWSAGPLYTKNVIKAQKVSRSWPKPLEPSNPGLKISHKRADDLPLVTQLDPDAQTREDAVLQPQDDFGQEAAWKACWEFLKRGAVQDDLREFWSQRKEQWHAMALRLSDPYPYVYATPQQPSPWFRIINLASNSEWLERSKELSRQEEEVYMYQSAVYGLMCGDVTSLSEVCDTVDDNLFTLFNALLISKYKAYLGAYREKLQNASAIVYRPPQPTLEHVRQYLVLSQTDEKTREESRQPHKSLEAAIICKDFDSFFVQQGQAAAQVAHADGTSGSAHLMFKDDASPVSDVAQLTARDPDSVRMVAHLQLLLKSLGFLRRSYETELYAIENNIVSYIGWLQREKEYELLPLYASKLSPERVPFVLGAILIDVVEPNERALQVRLMKRYEINIANVLWGIWSLANGDEVAVFKTGLKPRLPKITEYVGLNKVKVVKIRSDFMSDEISDQEDIAVRSAEWYKYINPEEWGRACYSISALFKMFLIQGKLSAARDLARRASLTDLSLAALGMNVHFAEIAETSENGDVDIDGVPYEEKVKPISPARKKKEAKEPLLEREGTSREILAAKSLVWSQLEQLIVAMDALERWTDCADRAETIRNNTAAIRALKKDLRTMLDEVREAMYPLLEADFLCKPLDDIEKRSLDVIRTHYLPECILAYNSVLYFAGHYISRSWLVECMNLAQVVATTDSLTKAFVDAKRMREFVDAMAWSAQGMVGASEVGRRTKTGKAEKEREGELGLWNVKWPEDLRGVGDLDALD